MFDMMRVKKVDKIGNEENSTEVISIELYKNTVMFQIADYIMRNSSNNEFREALYKISNLFDCSKNTFDWAIVVLQGMGFIKKVAGVYLVCTEKYPDKKDYPMLELTQNIQTRDNEKVKKSEKTSTQTRHGEGRYKRKKKVRRVKCKYCKKWMEIPFEGGRVKCDNCGKSHKRKPLNKKYVNKPQKSNGNKKRSFNNMKFNSTYIPNINRSVVRYIK